MSNKDNKASNKTSAPNPSAAMLFFFALTAVYCIFSIFMGGSDEKTKIILKSCYILFIITGEFFINLNLSNSICGMNQWGSTFYITIIPWILIFGVLHVALIMFPGWMAPFSNTFGYLVVKLMGLPELMKEIVAPSAKGEEAARAILSINSDDSLLVNQFAPESLTDKLDKDNNPTGVKWRKNFETAWSNLQSAKILNSFPDVAENMNKRNRLYKFVEMKYTIAELIWNLLAGFLVTSISYNYIVNIGCQKSAARMKQLHDDYEEKQRNKIAANQATQANQPNYRQT
jgi:hypothetical protein